MLISLTPTWFYQLGDNSVSLSAALSVTWSPSSAGFWSTASSCRLAITQVFPYLWASCVTLTWPDSLLPCPTLQKTSASWPVTPGFFAWHCVCNHSFLPSEEVEMWVIRQWDPGQVLCHCVFHVLIFKERESTFWILHPCPQSLRPFLWTKFSFPGRICFLKWSLKQTGSVTHSTCFELCVSKQKKKKGGDEKQAWLPFLPNCLSSRRYF